MVRHVGSRRGVPNDAKLSPTAPGNGPVPLTPDHYWARGMVDEFPNGHPDRAQVGRAAAKALSDVGFVRQLPDELEARLVRTAREGGVSWSEIAAPLGITRQTAWERRRDLDGSGANGTTD